MHIQPMQTVRIAEVQADARLGVNDDKSKANLAKDSRLAQIQKIANVEMMPTPQLRDFENKLFALKTCFQLGRPAFRRASLIYPQPVAIACGRGLRGGSHSEGLDACLRAGEVLTRYPTF